MKKLISRKVALSLVVMVAVFGLVGCGKKVVEEKQIMKETSVEKASINKEIEKFLEENGEKKDLLKVDTSNWQEYSNEDIPYTFKYPQDWYVEKDELSEEVVYIRKTSSREKEEREGKQRDLIDISETRNKDTAAIYFQKIKNVIPPEKESDLKYYEIGRQKVGSTITYKLIQDRVPGGESGDLGTLKLSDIPSMESVDFVTLNQQHVFNIVSNAVDNRDYQIAREVYHGILKTFHFTKYNK